MAGTEEVVEDEPECIGIRMDALAKKIDANATMLQRVLAILDKTEHKKKKDRDRIKQKRDEENAAQARAAGKIVVDRLEGTLHTDPRLPYRLWAYIMLEFRDAREFLRWLMNEYLESYFCVRDSRRRMIVRKGNHWKYYAPKCGTAVLVPPAKMFGGTHLQGQPMLDLICMRWCHFHVRPILEHVCTLDRLAYVHEKQMAWNDPVVNAEVGPPMPLESRWWKKNARFREIIHATLGVYGEGWIRTTKGSMLIDYDNDMLSRREVRLVFTDIARALHDGVNNRTAHVAWVEACGLQTLVDQGIAAHKNNLKDEAHQRFMESLHAHRSQGTVRQGAFSSQKVIQFAAAAKEEHDIQKAIEASLSTGSTTPEPAYYADDEKTEEPAPINVPPPTPGP